MAISIVDTQSRPQTTSVNNGSPITQPSRSSKNAFDAALAAAMNLKPVLAGGGGDDDDNDDGSTLTVSGGSGLAL